jgi:6-phosphogluconolactonase (cycloisomerase 2 family)
VKTFAPFLLLVFSTLILGCQGIRLNSPAAGTSGDPAGASGQSAPKEFVYAANLGSLNNPGGSISGFVVNEQTGGLVPVAGSPFPAGDSPGGITSDPLGHHVFVIEGKFRLVSVCSEAKGILLSENIDAHSGRLLPADKITLDGFCPQSMAVDPEGKTLYVSEETTNTAGRLNGGEIQAFTIEQNGTLTEISGSPLPIADGAGALAMHPGGKLLYVVTGVDDEGIDVFGPGHAILVFDRDQQTGALGPARAAAGGSQAHLAIAPSGRLMIAQNISPSNEVVLFTIDPASGALTPQIPMSRSLPWAVAVDPLSEFIAVTVAPLLTIPLPGEIQIFRIDDSTSMMTQVPGTPTAAGNAPFDVKFDLQGKLVYSVATSDNSIAGFMFDRSTGSLTPVPGSPFKAGVVPLELTIASPK